MSENFNSLKRLYEDGYRCIYYNLNENNMYTLHLKNFENEKSTIVELNELDEFDSFKSYVNDLNIY